MKLRAVMLALAFSACAPDARSPSAGERTSADATASDASNANLDATGDAGATGDSGMTSDPSARDEPRRTVLVVSIDGLRHDYLDDPARAPTLRRLRDQGAHASRLRSVWPSVTYPAHTTLVTGVRPEKHGISNNVVFDPYGKNDHGWYWYASDIRVPTLSDEAKKHGIEVGNVYWPVTVGADIPFSIPQMWRAKTDEDDKLLAALSTRGVMDGMSPTPAEHRSDRERTDAALHIIHRNHPRLMFVYLTDLDTVQHERGPMSKEALRTLRGIDGMVAELVAAAQAESPRVTLALVSDHGFSPVTMEVRPNVALRARGLLTAAGDKVKDYRVTTWKAGGSAALVPIDAKDTATARAAKELFVRLARDPANGIARVLDAKDTESAFAAAGAVAVLEARRGYVFSESVTAPMVARATYRGAHGYSPDADDMGATLFFQGDGVRAGDLGVVDMRDVAPTVARLLDFTLASAEGNAIAGALVP